MTLIWTRVDSKLIHGQIAAAWVPHLQAEVIVVADADTAGDLMSQRIMRLGLPPEISQVHFHPPVGLAGFLVGPDLSEKRVLLIFKRLADVLAAVADGLALKGLNLGNQLDQLSLDRGQRVAETFFASREELEALTRLTRRGLAVIIQSLPTTPRGKWQPPEPGHAG